MFHYVSLVPPTLLSLNLSLPSLFTPFPGLPHPHWNIFPLQGYREESEPTAAEPLGRLFLLLQDLVQDPSALTDQLTLEAASPVCTYRSVCSNGPTERWAVPLLSDGASERAEDMLGQRPGDHCTEFCYYSNYCSNHGNAMEDWSGLHCHCHYGCHRGRRRSQTWVCSVTRWVELNMIEAPPVTTAMCQSSFFIL